MTLNLYNSARRFFINSLFNVLYDLADTRQSKTNLVDKELSKQTKILAIQKGLSMSDIINDALVGYLNAKK